jgi:hypothetical protein
VPDKIFVLDQIKKLTDWCPNAKVHEARRRVNLGNFDSGVPDRARGENGDLKKPGWFRRISNQMLISGIFLTFVYLLIYSRKGLEPDHLLTASLTGLFMVLIKLVFRWNKLMERYDSIAKKPVVYSVPRIKSLGGLLVTIEVLFKISLFFLFILVFIPYMFNLSLPPISGMLVILLCPIWGYYFRLIYWEKKNNMKIFTKYENSFEKKYAFVKMYAVKEKKGEL